MAHAYERPDIRALDEVEPLARHLLDELAAWRRRCLKAETELQELRSAGGGAVDAVKVRRRAAELESENLALRQRVDTARDRVRSLAGRLSFLEQGGEAS